MHGRRVCRARRPPGASARPTARRRLRVRAQPPASAACRTARSHDAAAFALREYDLPAIPTLPRRSPAEGDDRPGASSASPVSRSASTAASPSTSTPLDPDAPVATDLANDAFGGIRTFLATAAGRGLRAR